MLYYNENKVMAGEAQLILASGFAGEIGQMAFQQKLNRFRHLTDLKPNVKTNAVHISLNFHASEELGTGKLQQIAAAYMEKIGFGDQPYLVYRHDDAAHEHIHIMTTNITAQAQRMDLHDIGSKLSEPARKAIEQEFKLVRAESKVFKNEPGIKAVNPEKAEYGHLPTKRAMSNVITAVARDYRFTSLAELNAALKCFNVIALRGAEHTQMFEKKGLMFSLLDEKGNPIGVPVKASAFYSKPTLRNLERKFEANREKRKPHREELKRAIDKVLKTGPKLTKTAFTEAAKKLGIDVAFRENTQGLIFGITYIDHRNKMVFNGSDLGKAYSAKAVLDKLIVAGQAPKLNSINKSVQHARIPTDNHGAKTLGFNFLETLLARTPADQGPPTHRKRKKRKKKGLDTGHELTL
jgi:hypothetical protein